MNQNGSNISENGKRIAKNTVFLYFRMLLMLFIGLFTSRVILKTLGVEDYGTYNAVGGLVTMFTFITAAIANAISRFLTFELGRGDHEKLRRVFSTSVVIQVLLSVVLAVLVETLGLWLLHHQLVIPDGRMGAATMVLHCSLGVLIINLMAVPYNATIIAHEKMSAFAMISVLEAVLKLSVAALLLWSPYDKLRSYAVMMLLVALLVRGAYAIFCKRHFDETRGKLCFDRSLIKEMLGFAGWSALSSGTFLFNTQGLNILTNVFFGVVANAARGVAVQVEGIVKQFVNNVVIALNPQITKSYVSDNKEYAYDLANKGAKFAYLIILFFAVPLVYEAEVLLDLWLDVVPPQAALFTVLTIFGTMLDMLFTAPTTLVLAEGRLKKYYLSICSVSVLVFPLTWVAFALGAPAYAAYLIFIGVYLVLDVVKLLTMSNLTGYPVKVFLRDVVRGVVIVTVLVIAIAGIPTLIWREATWWRMLITLCVSSLSMIVCTYAFALNASERNIVKSWIIGFLKKNG